MFDPLKFPVFILAALTLLLTPGPAVLYIVARSMDQGRVAGLVSVLSVEIGNFAHVLAATLGLSALLFSSAMAFNIVKYLGAAYLVYLGLKRILRPETPPTEAGLEKQSLGRIFSQGVAVAILNPKTALFFLAFLPQFVDPARGNVAWQLFSLGSIFVAMAVFTDGLYALLAGSAGQVLKTTPAFLKADRYLVGGIYIGLGILAAVSGANH